uniref:Uncharacterized protein n=1 Tax=Chromera velia CCMP2878 TaxID=1169474 RepID=A0A0G4H8W6_9ALVE|eukprot:Cvel_25241.t1-p1 / transcript=Cvel_25241.t1 / gene=Cvel_25241 / organism=Chromera_velia_CCMP2878 / gene_product=hypothetical protein / transcript_product=hypothetical protein / location=Cvel_scaffold2832:3862-4632(-) / protein_length=257 / sequence_SO=supercontig / SO=protein_coding / is_pseudo=false
MLITDFLAWSSAGWPHLTENEALRKLIKALDPRYDLPSVRKVQRLLLPTLKNEIILSIKDRLRKVATRQMLITLDMWSHSKKLGFLAITIHWLTENFEMDSASFLNPETTIYHSRRTNLKPKEAAADVNAEKAGGKLPPLEKVITPGEESYRPLYIHLQHKGLVVGPSAAQRVAELTNSGCLAAQKQDGSNTNSNSKCMCGSPSHPVVISPQPNRSPGAPTPGKLKSQKKNSQQLPPPIDSIYIEESDHEEEEKEVS